MRRGGFLRSGIGRVVHVLSTEQLVALNPESGTWPPVTTDGPALPAEAGAPVSACYRPGRAAEAAP
ncbi:hypothetical protein ACGF13_07320 [Kitasatospora sp. NPDC048286]|uniref:hypothetical protein n=1 Tax=Kitasatospora sp. NPDC048286 TaxID=3364047 RepID=UPI00371BF959